MITHTFSALHSAFLLGTAGYIYGNLANLPAVAVAKSWIITSIARSALIHLTKAILSQTKLIIKDSLYSGIVLIFNLAALNALEKQGLIGYKLKMCCKIMYIASFIFAMSLVLFTSKYLQLIEFFKNNHLQQLTENGLEPKILSEDELDELSDENQRIYINMKEKYDSLTRSENMLKKYFD